MGEDAETVRFRRLGGLAIKRALQTTVFFSGNIRDFAHERETRCNVVECVASVASAFGRQLCACKRIALNDTEMSHLQGQNSRNMQGATVYVPLRGCS